MKICMRFLAVLTAAACCVLPACGPADSDSGGSGGASASGGQTGSGGSGSGGSGSGGSTGSGGTGSGGSGSGGSASGGNGSGGSGSGGATGSGGSGSGGNASGGNASGGGTGSGGQGAGSGGAAGSAMGGRGAGGRGGPGGRAGGSGGSNGGNSGSTGSGGSTGTYNPCPTNGDPCRILPVGDSITVGLNSLGSYRVELFHKALMAMQKITYTGTLTNGPATVDMMPFPQRFEATSGITIDGISKQITSNKTLNMPADIAIIHIGTNDMYMTPAGAPDRLGKLIDQIITALPNALIVVCKIIPLNMNKADVDTYNAAIPGVVQTRVAAGKHIIIVDLFTGFPANGMDTVHPYASGYAWMGDKLYDAIGPLFPK